MRLFLFHSLFLLFLTSASPGLNSQNEPIYKTIHALGWEININSEFYDGDTSLLRKSFKFFGEELTTINDVLPKWAAEKLHSVVFWLESETTIHGYTGMYFASEYWLNKHNGNLKKVHGIEIGVSQYYSFKSRDNEWVIMHELAHAYQQLVVGYDDARIDRTFNIIKQAGLYKNVRHRLQTYAHGYVLKNSAEYFAEISTCYFGVNDYYPRDRSDLRQYDPLGYALVEALWHVKDGIEVE